MAEHWKEKGKSFVDVFEHKTDPIAGEKNWTWIRNDKNAWDGPSKNWEQSHQNKYFKHVKKFDVVVTAGANHGIHCRFYAKKFDKVYAFEPNTIAFHCLVVNNPFNNVIKMNSALGNKCGMVQVCGNPAGTSGTLKVKEGGTIPCLTIDVLNLDALDLLQLDAEGYEFKILQGALATIQKYRPVIIAENGRKGEILDFLTKINYEYIEQSVSDSVWKPK